MAGEPEAQRAISAGRSCARCETEMEAVALRSGRVWRCPSCHQLEI